MFGIFYERNPFIRFCFPTNTCFTMKKIARPIFIMLLGILCCTSSLKAQQVDSRAQDWEQVYNKLLEDIERFTTDPTEEKEEKVSHLPFIDKLIELGQKFLGKPYRYRGPSPWPMDCSGYISYLFSKFNISLPHNAAAQNNCTTSVAREDLRPGDLLFFKGRNSRSKRVGHVALVVEADDGDITMIHSRSSRGIVMEKLSKSAYFSRRLVGYGRISSNKEVSLGKQG